MPKITLREKHFDFLRILVSDFQTDCGTEPSAQVSQEVIDLTQEVLTLLNYARHFKRFTIEIESGDDGDEVQRGGAGT